MSQSVTDDFDRFGEALFRIVVGILIAVVVGVGSLIYWDVRERSHRSEIEKQKLDKFLVDHGDTVKLVRLQDESKHERSGKIMRTVERVWFVCEFEDGYAIEIEQDHGEATARVPQIGERWRVRAYKGNYTAVIYFYERVQKAPE